MKEYLEIIQSGEYLTEDQASAAMDSMMSGKAELVQVGALLMGLAVRGESEEELTGMLRSMRKHMDTVELEGKLLDTCGTGGDGHNTFNISTAAGLVCAALGVPVAKHGNRAASSNCGSADVLEALNIPIELKPKQAEQYFKDHNFVFLYARLFHPAMKHIAAVRVALGVRTIFNFLGPLANPAGASHQLIGVSDPLKAELIGRALINTGSKHVVIVYSDDGLDEASIAAPTSVLDMTSKKTNRFRIEPRPGFTLDDIKGGDPAYNAKLMKQLASGEANAGLIEAVAMNAGLALLAVDHVSTYEDGKLQAEQLLRGTKLSQFINQL